MKSSKWRWHLDEMFVKINGERHYLWRAVDHEGEVLESFVTKTRDKKAALKFLKKAMRKHGCPEVFVTDLLRSYGAALKEIGASRQAGNGSVDEQPERRIRTCRFDDENGPCFASGACEVCRNSPPSTPRSTITLIRNAAFQADPISS